MQSHSIWKETGRPSFPRVSQSSHYDVLIIGAGITGLSAALLLKEAGRKVCVIERGRIGSGDTGSTTAHLTLVTDVRLRDLVKTFGKEDAQLVWLGGAAAIDAIEHIVARHSINCRFRRVPGFLHASLDRDASDDRDTSNEQNELRDESELMRELGFEAAFLDQVPIVKRPGIRIPNQAKFHPLDYLSALARAVDGDGSSVFEHSNVDDFDADTNAALVGPHKIICDYLIIATHVPLMGKAGLIGSTILQTKLASYSTYVIGGRVPGGRLPEALFWDTSDPYNYLRVDALDSHDYIIFGGEDHKTGQETDTESHYARLETRLRELLPEIRIDHRWSGQIIETNDGLPYIGETAERQFALTGCAGNGMTYSTLGALMARDRVLGRDNPWSDLFSVGRAKIRGGLWSYLRENLDFPAYFLRDRLAHPDNDSLEELAPGEGTVLKLDGKRIACARDDKDGLTQVSAVCTHMGCLVRWNSAEQTWDCPCHGSRFRPDGSVLAGPAESPLEAFNPSHEAAGLSASSARKEGNPSSR
jgi:glycine/D-amino acid oxidase-like deaminating enzyme/nitrite reductase/ring-hydroxylating ferredoxin subunit